MALPTVDEVFASKTLKASDFPEPRLMTITGIDVQEFTDKKTNTTTKKFVFDLAEDDRAFVCNKTNAKLIEKYLGKTPEGWLGKKIVLYKADVEFGGNIVEAIRVRMPKGQAAAAAPAKAAVQHDELNPPPSDGFDDEIPF